MVATLAGWMKPAVDRAPGWRVAERARHAGWSLGQRLAGELQRRLARWAPPAEALARREPDSCGGPPLDIRVRPTPPTRARVGAWLAAVRQDAGCRDAAPVHAGCRAARQLAELRDPPTDVISTLEAALTSAGRAPCVAVAAVDALAGFDSPEAAAALARMRAVARRRAEWDGRAEDRALLAHITKGWRTRARTERPRPRPPGTPAQ